MKYDLIAIIISKNNEENIFILKSIGVDFFINDFSFKAKSFSDFCNLINR